MKARDDLKSFAESRGLSYRAISKKLGVALPLVSMWVSGERSPGLPNATKLEKLTGIPAAKWVLRRRDRRSVSSPTV